MTFKPRSPHRALALALLAAALASAGAGCSLKSRKQGSIRIELPRGGSPGVSVSSLSSRQRFPHLAGQPSPSPSPSPSPGQGGSTPPPGSFDEFNCFGINVTGPGIDENPNVHCKTDTDRAGIMGGLVSADQGFIEVQVPAGSDRVVQLIGFKSAIGCSEINQLLSTADHTTFELLGHPYQLGVGQTDVQDDTTLSILATYDPTAPIPLYQGCNTTANPATPGVLDHLDIIAQGPTSFIENTCVHFTVNVLDQFSQTFALPTPDMILLSGGGLGTFYSDSGCGTSTNSIPIGQGQATVDFWFQDSYPEGISIYADLTGATQGFGTLTCLAQPQPTVTSISPTHVPDTGSTTIAVHGADFGNSPSVLIDGSPCQNVVVIDTTFFTCEPAPHAAGGPYDVTVSSGDSPDGTLTALYYDSSTPAPVISSFNPTTVSETGGTVIDIYGSDFDPAATANIDGNDCPIVTYYDATHLRCTTPAIVIGNTASRSVIVVNPDVQQAALGGLTYRPTPIIGSFSPTAVPKTGGTVITIHGTGFDPTATVNVDGYNCPVVTFTDSTQLSCTTPNIVPGTPPTNRSVTVTNPDSQQSTLGGLMYIIPPPPAGALSAGFGSGGILIQSDGTGTALARGVGFQSTGMIVVAHETETAGNWNFGLTRFHPDGSIDAGFGTGGTVTTPVGNYQDNPKALVVQPDDKIVVVGNCQESGGPWDACLVRYNSDGSLDTGFGTGGKVMSGRPGEDTAYAVVLQPDGKLVVGGNDSASGNNFSLERFNPDGSVDTGFGSGGTVSTDFAGSTDTIYALALQDDGKIVAAGQAYIGFNQMAAARYNPDGTLDTAFGVSSGLAAPIGESFEEGANGVAIQKDGKIVLAGYSVNSGGVRRPAMLRLYSDGTQEVGWFPFVTAGTNSNAYAVGIREDGVILMAGGYDQASATPKFFVIAITPGPVGGLFPDFDGGGLSVTTIGSTATAYALAIAPDGAVVAAGNSVGDLALVRYNRPPSPMLWNPVATLAEARSSPVMGAVDGKILVATGVPAGGFTTTTMEAYDPGGNAWSARAPIPTGRSYTMNGVIGGKFYVAGGCIGADCIAGLTGILEAYNPQNDTWASLAPLPAQRNNAGFGVLGGKLYVVGGMAACGPCTVTPTLYVYDPATDTWTQKASMPTARTNPGVAAIGGLLYAIGGYDAGGYSNVVEVYDPVTDLWSTRTPLTLSRTNLAAVALNGFIYAIGGNNGGTPLDLVSVYDPQSNSWYDTTPMRTPRLEVHACVLNNEIYITGAGAGGSVSDLVERFH